MTESLSNWQKKAEQFRQAEAEILWTLNTMPEKYPLEFKHGMTHQEVKEKHTLLVKEGRFKHVLKVYDNKMRALFKDGTAGRHTVHGQRHYFAVAKHEQKKVDHRECTDDDLPVKAEFKRASEMEK